jgi:hypothetical protein
VDFVASRAGDGVFGMAALQSANVGRLIQVTGETNAIGSRSHEFRRIAD